MPIIIYLMRLLRFPVAALLFGSLAFVFSLGSVFVGHWVGPVYALIVGTVLGILVAFFFSIWFLDATDTLLIRMDNAHPSPLARVESPFLIEDEN